MTKFSLFANTSLATVPKAMIEASMEGLGNQTEVDSVAQMYQEVAMEQLRPHANMEDDECSKYGGKSFKCSYITKQPSTSGESYTSIYLFGAAMESPTFSAKQLPALIMLLETASENDTIELFLQNPTLKRTDAYALLNSLTSTKAKTITNADILSSALDVAIWLSGKEFRASKFSMISIQALTIASTGLVSDAIVAIKQQEEENTQLLTFLASKGFLTQDDLNDILIGRKQVTLFGPQLQDKLNNVKK